MEGDDIIQRQVSKFQKIRCNGSSVINDSSSNPNKIATHKGNHLFPVGDGGGNGGDDGRLFGWPSSRIVRVSRASGGKDRHSKVLTSKGLRDRRIRLSVSTAIEFYDLQDRLGYDQPSKAVEWLIKAASSSIDELPPLDPSFPGGGCTSDNHHQEQRQLRADNNNNNNNKSTGNDMDFENPTHQHHQQQQNNNSNSNSNNNNACSSTSETSKGSGLSLSRSENRIRARERARDLAAKKEKVKESAISSSFTDLLTGGININNNNNSNPHMDYFHMPQFNNIPTRTNQHQNQQEHQPENHHFPFLQGNFASGAAGGLASGLNRGTLQSNLLSSLPHNQHLQRPYQASSMMDGSTSNNFPFFMAPTINSNGPDHYQATGFDSQRLQLYGGGRPTDHYKEKSKN